MRTFVMLSGAALLCGTIACNSAPSTPVEPSGTAALPNTDANSGRRSEPSIVDIAVGSPDFSTLVAALTKAGLVDIFNSNPHYTVFAPTNAAFDAAALALGQPNGQALVAALDVPTLTAVLTYHVTRGDRNATSVVSAGSVLMLDGNTARIEVVGGAARIDNATIVATDIRARNGIVHVIDGVLLPPALR